jgi:hypothetical protein
VAKKNKNSNWRSQQQAQPAQGNIVNPEAMEIAVSRNNALVQQVLACGSEDSAEILDTVSDIGLVIHESHHGALEPGQLDRIEMIANAMEAAMLASVDTPTITEFLIASFTLMKITMRNQQKQVEPQTVN